jgi:Cu/Ag efflux protein CusF
MKMKTLKPFIASCVLAAALPVLATDIEAPPVATDIETPPAALSGPTLVEATATVEAVDAVSRFVTLKGPEGGLFTVKASDEVKNLSNVKAGDLVHVKYYRSIAVDVVASGGAQSGAEPSMMTETVTAEPEMAPAAAVGRQERRTAKILSIDPYKKSIAFRDDRGQWREMWMDKPELEHYLTDLKEGDTIQVTFTEALAVSVEPR